jgi:hypothetical protein
MCKSKACVKHFIKIYKNLNDNKSFLGKVLNVMFITRFIGVVAHLNIDICFTYYVM